MTRLLYDSTTASDIRADAPMVAGYINGSYTWSDADWARFPNAVKVRIAVNAQTNDGHVLDVEDGDALPHEAPAWVLLRRAAGVEPSVYCNLSNVDEIKAAFVHAGVPLPPLWLAHYDGIPVLPDGYIAKQYADEALTGGHYDVSIVADYWPGIDKEADVAFKDDPDAQAFVKDVRDTIEAMKKAYDPLVHHPHLVPAGRTSEPLIPPVPGAAYFSSNDALDVIGWTYPDGLIHFFQRGVEIPKP